MGAVPFPDGLHCSPDPVVRVQRVDLAFVCSSIVPALLQCVALHCHLRAESWPCEATAEVLEASQQALVAVTPRLPASAVRRLLLFALVVQRSTGEHIATALSSDQELNTTHAAWAKSAA